MKYMNIGFTPFRRELLKHKLKLFRKGDHRFQDTYYCAACGFPLVTYNIKTCNYSTNRNMYKVLYNGSIVYLCCNSKICKQYRMDKKGDELIRVVIPD